MGPLDGLRIIELASVGPGPFCAMLLADLGAEVLRIDRIGPGLAGFPVPPEVDVTRRGRRSIALDLKTEKGVDLVLRLAEKADALIEGFRPGVAERLGIGPDACHERNPRLVYGRITGWGQTGPLANAAGHDVNYIALTGALHAIGSKDGPPIPPLNLVGDYGGGALYLAIGVLSAIIETKSSGRGQVVDAAMVDGAASLMTAVYGHFSTGLWKDGRGRNPLDGGAHFYGVYETADGKHVSIAAIEPQFYERLLELIGLADEDLPDQWDRARWPEMCTRFAAVFSCRSRDEWCALLEGTDACFAPVLSLAEAPEHRQIRERATLVEYGGITQPAPAPRFSRTQPQIKSPPAARGAHTSQALAQWGLSASEIEILRTERVIADRDDLA